MSKIFLLASNITTEPYPVYPLGMAVIASALEADGHVVCQFDFLASEQSDLKLQNALSEFTPDYVGISIRNIDNVDSLTPESDWYLEHIRDQVNLIREKTTAPVIIGGPAFSIMPEEILAYIGADYGIVGEGEHKICELIHTLNNGETMPAIIKGDTLLTGNQMCSPLFTNDMVRFYKDTSGMINLQTKRGCPYSCAYCTYPLLEGNCFRNRDPETIVHDILKIKKDYQADCFFFTDSVFNDAGGHYLEFAEELIRQEAAIRWAGFFRPQAMNRSDVRVLKRSGMYAMEVGTDASSDATLAGLNKGFCFDDVMTFNKNCVEENIPVAHFIIFGGPGETEETITEGLENIKKLEKCVVFAFSGIRILPGTGIYKKAVTDGLLATDDSLLKPVYYFSPEIDPEKMNQTIETDFNKRRDRIFPPSEGQMRIKALNLFGVHGLLWDMLLSEKKRKHRRKRQNA